MECWTWGDVAIYFLCTIVASCWCLSPLGIFILCLKFPFFLLFELPVSIALEFKFVTFERRIADRNFSTFFEYTAMLFVRWVLQTFHNDVVRDVFFGEIQARALFRFRRFKYGTENIGDFDYERNPKAYFDGATATKPQGYWIRSRSRRHQIPDLVIYFVPGNLLGCASPYVYLEYLSMMLVELQVQGFRNPVVFCVDIDFSSISAKEYGFATLINEVTEGWRYVRNEYPHAKTLAMGSGIGATALLSMLLQIAKPFIDVPLTPATEPLENLSAENSKVTANEDGSVSNNTSRSTSRSTSPSVSGNDARNDAGSESLDDSIPSAIGDQSEVLTAAEGLETSRGKDCSTVMASGLKKPDALLLLSPISRVAMTRKDHCGDFITNRALDRALRRLVRNESDSLWTMPGRVRDSNWWSAAIPDKGSVIMFGGLETLGREEKQLVQTLKGMGGSRVVADCRSNEVHAWPIARAFLARTTTDQMDGISQVADHIAKMLVMDCLFANSSLSE